MYAFSGSKSPLYVSEEAILVSNFEGASWNFVFDFFNKKVTKNGKNQQRTYRKYLLNIIDLQKIFILWPNTYAGQILEVSVVLYTE